MPFSDPEKRRTYLKAWRQRFREKNGKSYEAIRIARWAIEVKTILGVCQGCGTRGNHLEFAHIKKTPLSDVHRFRGRWRRYLDIIHHPDCYTFFCGSCHYLYDHERLAVTPKSLLELQEDVKVRVWGKRLFLPLPAEPTPIANVPVIRAKE